MNGCHVAATELHVSYFCAVYKRWVKWFRWLMPKSVNMVVVTSVQVLKPMKCKFGSLYQLTGGSDITFARPDDSLFVNVYKFQSLGAAKDFIRYDRRT